MSYEVIDSMIYNPHLQPTKPIITTDSGIDETKDSRYKAMLIFARYNELQNADC